MAPVASGCSPALVVVAWPSCSEPKTPAVDPGRPLSAEVAAPPLTDDVAAPRPSVPAVAAPPLVSDDASVSDAVQLAGPAAVIATDGSGSDVAVTLSLISGVPEVLMSTSAGDVARRALVVSGPFVPERPSAPVAVAMRAESLLYAVELV